MDARKNRGFFVREAPGRPPPGAVGASVGGAAPLTAAAARGPGPVNATALIRGMFHQISDKPQPGMGVFPPDWLETTFMPTAVRKVTSSMRMPPASNARAMGTAWATSLSTITGMTGASCMICRGVSLPLTSMFMSTTKLLLLPSRRCGACR